MTPAARELLRLRRYQRDLRRQLNEYRTPHALQQIQRLRSLVGARS